MLEEVIFCVALWFLFIFIVVLNYRSKATQNGPSPAYLVIIFLACFSYTILLILESLDAIR